MSESKLYTINETFKKHMSADFLVDGEIFNMSKLGWVKKYGKKKNSFGTCRINRSRSIKEVILSEWMIKNSDAPISKWEDTVLHEIAHAIDFERRGSSSHDHVWRSIALQIGCVGERCGSAEIDPSAYRYKLTCNNCDEIVYRHKSSRKTSACYNCCKTHNNGYYDSRYALTFHLNNTPVKTTKKPVEARIEPQATKPQVSDGKVKIDWNEVLKIRQQFADGVKNSVQAKHYGVSSTCIYNIVRNKTWKNK